MKNSKKTYLAIALLLTLSNSGFIASAQVKSPAATKSSVGFLKTENGMQYKIAKHGTGTESLKVGDFVEMYINVRYNDSELNDSRRMNNNKPVAFPIQKSMGKGDPVEAFMHLKAGDSAIIRILADTLLKTGGSQLPPFIKPGGIIEFRVVLLSIKGAEQKQKEDAAKATVQKDIDAKLLRDYFAKNSIKPSSTESGLYYSITKEGSGDKAKAGQTVTVNYTGRTLDGKTFDSNVDSNFHHMQPFPFTLGQHQVISGWDEGVALLKKGAQATLYIPSTMAYGAQSPSPAIPANSVLIFDIEVTDIKDADTKH